MDTDISLLLVENSAHRFPRGPALRREGLATVEHGRRPVEPDEDESLVEDQRESLRPAQHVERKLVALLQSSPVLVSHLQKFSRPHGR